MSERSLVTWTALVFGYSQNGYSEEALAVFSAMHRIGVKANQFTYGSALRACTSMMCLDRGKQIQGCIQKSRLVKNLFVQSALVDLHSKCRKLEDACYIFESMSERDVVSWNAMIGGYAVQGFADDALRLFRSMLRAASLDLGRQIHALVLKCQSKHDVAMENTLIDMYSKSGEIEDAKQVFNEMEQKNVISWTSLIAGYGKHGYGHKAIALYEKMECEGLKPNDVTFPTLLFSCSHAGLTTEALECFNNMVGKYNILPRAEHYSCMVDVYCTWREVRRSLVF
ncbi:hypothetical protein HYC85_012153 [Camellia sinensis]|uniref:Pentacotripeptide-repeat region of PRORP domain-containing protein n=1 Tax=Camellia sinensis TaxID=4442 RepID=A0A7J7HB48_CAMSI|nr:hypothetical protein HYC85_012153 [Camellia sinensis]